MKKKWLALLLAAVMAVSPTVVQAIGSRTIEYVGWPTKTAEEAVELAENTEYTSTEASANVALADVSALDAADIVNEAYVKYVPNFEATQPVEDGTYIIVGARNGYNQNSVITRTTTVQANVYTALTYTNNVSITNDVISQKLANSEWEVKYVDTTSNGARYTFKAPGEEKYLAIYESDSPSGAVSASTAQNLVIKTNTNVTNSATIGGQSIANSNSTGYLNHRNNPGTWTGTDVGSAWFLYRNSYTLDTAAIAEVTAEVGDKGLYTTDSWNVYADALDKAEAAFATEDAAVTAYAELQAAVVSLVKIDLPEGVTTTTTGEHYELVKITAGSTAIEPGIYMLVSSRHYSAMLGEDTKNTITSHGTTYGDLLEKLKVGKTASGQDYGGDQGNSNYETQHPTKIYVEKSWNGASVEWEIIANDNGIYYLRNVSNQKYLSMTANGNGTVQDNPVATAITGKSAYGSESYNGSVEIKQGNFHLNLFGGSTGYFGGYNGESDGGNAIYLYKKVAESKTYDADVTALQSLVTECNNANYQAGNYTTASWSAYETALNAAELLLRSSHAFQTVEEAEADKANVDAAYQALRTAKANLREVKLSYTMEELYAAILAANGGSFLFSEECYTTESGHRYRDALIAARQTYTTEEEAQAAFDELIASVENLKANVIADSVFPRMNWEVTVDRNRTTEGETNLTNYVSNVAYVDTDGYDPGVAGGNVTFDANEALTWEWDKLARLVNDEDERIYPVWGMADNGMFARRFAAAGTSNWALANAYKISGEFAWPEGYTLSETTIVLDSVNDFFYRDIYEYISANNLGEYFELDQVFPVNDDVYVVLWAETENGAKPTVETIDNYLAFWSGTSGKGIWTQKNNTGDDWGRTEPATFIEWNLQGERAFRDSYPNKVGTGALKENGSAYTNADVVDASATIQNYLDHTDGWYTMANTTAVNSVMRSNYRDEDIKPGTIIHVDLYVMNNSGEGMIDQLEIELFKEKETKTTVTVNYYLNEVTKDGFLGAETLLNQEYGTAITLAPGAAAGQLNSYKKEAIFQAGYKDVTDGVQLNELVVTEGADNVINVLYTVKGEKIVYLRADNGTFVYNGEAHELNNVIVTENGYENEAVPVEGEAGKYTLPDGHVIEGVFASVSQVNPGIYDNNFGAGDIIIRDADGNNVTNTYSIVKIPGKLTITYTPDAVTRVYDFGERNVYELSTILNNMEKAAEAKVNGTAATEITYVPTSVNTSEAGEVTLVFPGGYTVKKVVNFVPASNVLYGEKFITKENTSVWTTEGTAAEYTVDDNESTAYGYTADITATAVHSNNSAYKAVLDVNGDSGISGLTAKTDALTFEFTGTGFDLYSACGPDTGMLVVKVEDTDPNAEKKVVASYLVDTYFTGDDKLISAAGTDVIDYQIPVVRKMGLAYGTYKVTVYGYLINTAGALATYGMEDAAIPVEDIVITALEDLGLEDMDVSDVEIAYLNDDSVLNGGTGNVAAESGFGRFALTRDGESGSTESGKDSKASVYVDGFRVYQPLNGDSVYTEKEQGTTYHSVYDFMKTTVNDLTPEAMLYIEYDGNTGVASIADYKIQGPQNEVYLTAGNAVAFALDNYTEGNVVQIGAKSVVSGAELSSDDGANSTDLCATEMYYDVTVQKVNGFNCVVIKNTGTGVLALSGLKVSSNLGIYASAEVGKQIVDGMNGSENTETMFEITTAEKVQRDRRFTISVETSKDVKMVRLVLPAGNTVDMTAYNAQAVESGAVATYKYSHSIVALKDQVVWTDSSTGTYTFTAIALDANGEVIGESTSISVMVE